MAPERNDELVELLAATAHYHVTGCRLGLHHTVNFGRPWWKGSRCTYGLISLPYLDGQDMEWIEPGIGTRCLWLVPVTKQEVEYKIHNGIDALEDRFEDAELQYLDPFRDSVV